MNTIAADKPCTDPSCTLSSPCPSCSERMKAFNTFAGANQETMAGLDLDNVFESAVIEGILAITWRDGNGQPLKDGDGNVTRGLPKLMAEDFWTAYGAAKKAGMQKIADVVAKAMAAQQAEQAGQAEQAETALSGAKLQDEVSTLMGKDSAPSQTKPSHTRRVKPRVKKASSVAGSGLASTAKSVNGTNGLTSDAVSDLSDKTPPEAPVSSTKLAH